MSAPVSNLSESGDENAFSWLFGDRRIAFAWSDPAATAPPLLPHEHASIAGASAKRRREFAQGRASVRRAIALLGMEPQPILTAPDRTPVWPTGLVGSISHCDGLCGAAVGLSDEIRSIGIDIEPRQSLPIPANAISSRAEQDGFPQTPPPEGMDWPMIAFVAKEAFYKCHYMVARRFLAFRDGHVDLMPLAPDGLRGHFRIHLSGDPHSALFEGRWMIALGHIFACALLPHLEERKNQGSR